MLPYVKGAPTVSATTTLLLGLGAPGSMTTKGLIGAGIIGGLTAAEKGERIVRLMMHPGVRKHVANVLVGAAKQRAPMVVNSVASLNKIVNKLS